MKTRGDSGLDITQVMDDKVTIVGVNPNMYPSCKTDGAGRDKKGISASATEGIKDSNGTFTENAAIDNGGDHHGGVYSIIAMNRFTVDTGAGGIVLTSYGNINLLAGGGLANIVAASCATLDAPIVKLAASEVIVLKGTDFYVDTKSTTFTNTVKFGKNLMVKGGAVINGELYVSHITAPFQMRKTFISPVLPVYFNTPTTLSGTVKLTCKNPVTIDGVPVMPKDANCEITFELDPVTTKVAQGKVYPHSHVYLSPSWSYPKSSAESWEEVEKNGENNILKAKPNLQFGDKISVVVEKDKRRLTNAFTDTLLSLAGKLF